MASHNPPFIHFLGYFPHQTTQCLNKLKSAQVYLNSSDEEIKGAEERALWKSSVADSLLSGLKWLLPSQLCCAAVWTRPPAGAVFTVTTPFSGWCSKPFSHLSSSSWRTLFSQSWICQKHTKNKAAAALALLLVSVAFLGWAGSFCGVNGCNWTGTQIKEWQIL